MKLKSRKVSFDCGVEQRLEQLGLQLPTAPKPAGNYSAFVLAGNLLFLSGQFPITKSSAAIYGRVGSELTEQQGYTAARLAALNVLAQLRAALGRFDRLETLLRVEGYVASAQNWHNTPKALDGASDLFTAVLGRRGSHSRAAFNVPRLPCDFAVELVVTAAIKPR